MTISSMPPKPPAIDYGRATSNRWGGQVHNVDVKPQPPPVASGAGSPTCDRWGHVIEAPVVASPNEAPVTQSMSAEVASGKVDWE